MVEDGERFYDFTCYYLPCNFIRRNYEMVILFEVYLEITSV